MSDGSGARVFVTGAHGFIGRYVVRMLAGGGYRVVAAARDSRDRDDSLPADIVEVDLAVHDEVKAAMQGCDQVIHLAARAGGIQFQRGGAAIFGENRAITDSVIDAALGSGVRRMFLASSAVVYRSSDHTVAEDDDLLGPIDDPTPYAWSKITDEVAAQWISATGQLDTVIGRFGNVYGPGAPFDPERSTVVHALIRRTVDAPPGGVLQVWGDGSAVRSFIYVDDVARAILTVLRDGDPSTVYNIDSGVAVTIRELAELVRDAVDPSIRLDFDSTKPTGVRYRVTDPKRLHGLGFEATMTLEAGIARTVAALREEIGSG